MARAATVAWAPCPRPTSLAAIQRLLLGVVGQHTVGRSASRSTIRVGPGLPHHTRSRNVCLTADPRHKCIDGIMIAGQFLRHTGISIAPSTRASRVIEATRRPPCGAVQQRVADLSVLAQRQSPAAPDASSDGRSAPPPFTRHRQILGQMQFVKIVNPAKSCNLSRLVIR